MIVVGPERVVGIDSLDFERFINKVQFTDSCWNWTGYRDKKGYAPFWLGNKTLKAHRVAYTWWVGPIPDGLTVDHECENTGCVNPDHLSVMTAQENLFSSMGSTSEYCRRGHLRTEYKYFDSAGSLRCRLCHKLNNRRYQASLGNIIQ